MRSEPRTLREIADEVLTEGYWSRARERAQRRRSPWNLLLIPLVLGGVALTFYLLFQLMWQVHIALHPEHAGRLAEFWRKYISFRSFVSSLLLAVPLGIVALPLGMILGNLIAWSIPPARRAFEREAKGVSGASLHQSVVELGKLALFLLPFCLILSLIGAATLDSLR